MSSNVTPLNSPRELHERIAACVEQVEQSPYRHTTAAAWYAEDVPPLLAWLDDFERWASAMPDAGLTSDDPRWGWYGRRPQYPNYPAEFDPLKRQQELAIYWKRRYEEATGVTTPDWAGEERMFPGYNLRGLIVTYLEEHGWTWDETGEESWTRGADRHAGLYATDEAIKQQISEEEGR